MLKTEITDRDIFNADMKARGQTAFEAAMMARKYGRAYMLFNSMVVETNMPLSSRDDFKNAVVFTPSENHYMMGFEFNGWNERSRYTGSNPALKNR